MAILAILSVVGGVLQIPGVTHVVEHFLHPSFEDSRFAETEVSGGLETLALVVGGLCAIAGIGLGKRWRAGGPLKITSIASGSALAMAAASSGPPPIRSARS